MAKKTLATMNANHAMKMARKEPVVYVSAPRKYTSVDAVLWVTTILNKETQKMEVGHRYTLDYYDLTDPRFFTNVLDSLADGYSSKFTTSNAFQFMPMWKLENQLQWYVADRTNPHFKSFFRVKENRVKGRLVSEFELYIKPLDPA